MTLEKSFVSAVIYIKDDGEKAVVFVTRIMDTLEGAFECSEVICVDDASSDGSAQAVKNAVLSRKGAGTCSVTMLTMGTFAGREKAVHDGDETAIGDFVFEFDSCKMDYDESVIMEVFHKAQEGLDIVGAVPKGGERLSSKVFYHIFARYAKMPQAMTTERFRLLSRRALNRVRSMGVTVPYRKVMYASCGLRYCNVRYKASSSNRAHITAAERRYRRHLAVDSLLLFTSVGYRLSLGMTAFMMVCALFATAYSIAVYFVVHSHVQGWTTTMLLLSLSFFGLFGILSIVLRYLALIVDLVFKKKWETFQSIERITGVDDENGDSTALPSLRGSVATEAISPKNEIASQATQAGINRNDEGET